MHFLSFFWAFVGTLKSLFVNLTLESEIKTVVAQDGSLDGALALSRVSLAFSPCNLFDPWYMINSRYCVEKKIRI